MRKVKILKPKDGLNVPNPLTKLNLNKDGEPVVMSTYWVRRLKDGDVVEVKESKKQLRDNESPKKSNNKKSEE